MDVTIEVTRAYVPAMSTIGYAEGWTPDGRYVELAGDHRMIREISAALDTWDDPVFASGPDYAVRALPDPDA